MSASGLLPEFRDWAAEHTIRRFVVIDPGGTTGTGTFLLNDRGALVDFSVGSLPLAELPMQLLSLLELDRAGVIDAVLCEDFSLSPRRRNDPKMPASQGIGMCRVACEWTGTPLFLLQPNMKTEGRGHLDEAGERARAACRNEHQRDVVDFAGKAIHEYRKARR